MHNLVLAHPFSGLVTRTDKTIDTAEKSARRAEAQRVRIAALAFATTLPDLFFLAGDLDRGIELLNSPELDSSSESELRQLTHAVAQLNGRLSKLLKTYEAVGIADKWVYHYLLDRIRSRNGHLTSIVEGLRMSLNPDFGALLAQAAQDLRAGGSDRRTPVGRM
jgi:hypothetical protein